jgi:hypothetical protein
MNIGLEIARLLLSEDYPYRHRNGTFNLLDAGTPSIWPSLLYKMAELGIKATRVELNGRPAILVEEGEEVWVVKTLYKDDDEEMVARQAAERENHARIVELKKTVGPVMLEPTRQDVLDYISGWFWVGDDSPKALWQAVRNALSQWDDEEDGLEAFLERRSNNFPREEGAA